jgi:hypothetical protein
MTALDAPAVAAYILCVISVAIQAQQRLATPRSNRASTRLSLYRQAEFGYVCCTLVLFILLSFALQYGGMRQLLLGFGLSEVPKINSLSLVPAPLIATVLLTIWLPKVILIRDVDGWLLNFFKTRANIPREVQDRASRLTHDIFVITAADLEPIERMIEEQGLPETLSAQLASERGRGIQLSRYRLTRVLTLYLTVLDFNRDPRCARLVRDFGAEWEARRNRMRAFCVEAADAFAAAELLQAKLTPAEYEALMAEKRQAFSEASATMFADLAMLVAAAVLNIESTEHGIGERLRSIGFNIADEPDRPEFPLSSLSGLSLLLLLYIIVTDQMLRRYHLMSGEPPVHPAIPEPAVPFFIVLSHAVTIGVTVWVIQRYPRLQRQTWQRPRWDIYLVCSVVGAVIVQAAWLVLFTLTWKQLPQSDSEWNLMIGISLIVGSLCGAVAFFCDLDDARWPPTRMRRLAEALGCMAVMALVAILLPLVFPIMSGPKPSATLAGFPASVAAIVGYFVPHMVRAERSLARQRNEPDKDPVIAGASHPAAPQFPPAPSEAPDIAA